MSIAEQITQLKTDFDEVYEAGYEKGKAEGGGGDTEQAFEDGKIQQNKKFWRRELWRRKVIQCLM